MKRHERWLTLAAEIENELRFVHRVAEELEHVWNKAQSASLEDHGYFLESAALKLHNFYTGCERIFEKIAVEVNGGRPRTFDWHMRLLQSMALDVPQVRPAVISSSLEKQLAEYLGFRHVVRNIYGFELDPGRIARLIEKINRVSTQFTSEIEQFVSYLRELATGVEANNK